MLFLGSTSFPRCGGRQDGKEVSPCLLALWPLVVPREFTKRPLTFLWQTLGNEGLGVGLFLCSGNVLERQGLVEKKHGHQASTGDWIFQPVFATFNLYRKGCVLEGLILIGNTARKGLNNSTRAQVLSGQPLLSLVKMLPFR